MTKDMTTGSPLRLIIGFAVPMFLGMLFQQFYSMVDTIIVGKFLGVDPLAGVGSTSFPEFSGHRFLYGSLQWLRGSCVSDVRRQKGGRAAKICGQQRLALHTFFAGNDGSGSGALPADPDVFEYAGKYF